MSSTPDTGTFTVLPPRLTTSGSHRVVTELPDAALLHLLTPKWITARARAMQGRKGRGARLLILGIVGALFWLLVYGVLYRLLTDFRVVEQIGALLAGRLLGLLMLRFTSSTSCS